MRLFGDTKHAAHGAPRTRMENGTRGVHLSGQAWTEGAVAREHPPMMLNVLENVFRVPLVLGPDGKRNAIAVRLLEHCDIEDTNTNRASAMAVIGQIAQLGENGTLDPLIGGYDRGERAGIID